jgi:hypothetical protein
MYSLSVAEIEKLTLEYGENWALAHVRRLLKLIEQIGAGMEYDRQDQLGCDHALLSRQIAESEILPQTDLPAEVKAKILEAIELHDYRDQRPAGSAEVLLLREADFLDFLGAIGIAREFAKGPKNIQKSYQQLLKRREEIKDRFTIPQALKIADERLVRMDEFFKHLLDESFGYF